MKNSHITAGSLGVVFAICTPLIMYYEGVEYEPYYDSVGVLTVCYGHTKNVTPGKKYSKNECLELLNQDMQEANQIVNQCLPMPKLPQIEGALTSATFNIGGRVVCGSTLQKKATANDWVGACNELARWNKAGGRVLKGLTLRRLDEQALCLYGK